MHALDHKTTAGVDVRQLERLSSESSASDSRDHSLTPSVAASRYSLRSNAGTRGGLDTDSVQSVIHYLQGNSGYVWIDIQDPLISEVQTICNAAFGGLHPLSLELLENVPSRETIQEVKSYLFTTFGPRNVMIVFEQGIISLTRGQSTSRGRIQARVGKSLPFHPDWICYALVEEVTRNMIPVMRQIDHDATWVNDHVYVSVDNVNQKEVLSRLAETRQNIVASMTKVRGKLEITESLARRWSEGDVGHYFNDVEDNLTTMKYRLESHESLLGYTHRNWMAVTQMNLEKTKSKILVVVGQFLALAAIFVPMLTVFTAAHMNLAGPGMHSETDNSLAWWGTIVGVVVGLAIIIVLLSYRYFRGIMNKPVPSLTGN